MSQSQETVHNYNWGEYDFSRQDIQVLDTSLRDGLQDSRIEHPSLDEKVEFARRLAKIGIDAIDVAIPIAGGPHLKDAIRIARELPPTIDIACLTRTTEADIRAALELSQGAGRKVEAIIFIGSSPLRRRVEGWEVSTMVEGMKRSVELASKKGIIPNIATEHTTETEPEVIERIFKAGLDFGGRKVCIADTTGAATHHTVRSIINFFKEVVLPGYDGVDIDWHGHNDRDHAVEMSLLALENGARRVHGTALGIGERAGNTRLESLLINLKIGQDPKRQDLTALPDFSQYSSKIFGKPIPEDYPGIGAKAGETASGIHAAAMYKAQQLGMESGAPYSIVNQSWFSRESDVRIGPLSGHANVRWRAEKLGIPYSDELAKKVLEHAQISYRIISDTELRNIYNSSIRNNGGK